MSSILKPVLGSQLNFGHPLAQGLAGLWLFNKGSGGQVFDLVNGNTGTLAGDTHWVAGKFGPALKFDGTGDVVGIGTNPKLGFTSEDYTLYLYFMITDSSDSDWLYSKGQANNDGFYVQVRNNNIIRVITAQDGAQQETDTTTTFSDNVWHSLVVVRKGSYIHIYLDGVECSYLSQPVITDPDDASARTAYISGYFADYGIVGLISHGAVWNGRALSASEIALLHREPFCMFERIPIELWAAATQGGVPPAGIPIFRRRIEAA